MDIMNRDLSGPSPRGERDPGRDYSKREPTLRRIVAEIVQRIPSDRYTLILRSRALGAVRWRRCLVGDLAAPRLLDAIEEGAMWLCLRDVGAVLRAHLGPLGYDFPDRSPRGERLSHGLVVASGDQALTLDAAIGSGLLLALEGDVRLVFSQDEIRSGEVTPEWPVDIRAGHAFEWRSARPRRFETGGGLVIALTRAVVPEPSLFARLRLATAVDAARRLHRRIFGAPERWATSLMGSAPIGGHSTPEAAQGAYPDYRLVRWPSRGPRAG